MNRFKKEYGFKMNEPLRWWKDRMGNNGGRIIKIVWLPHIKDFQVFISNGDILTTEIFLGKDIRKRNYKDK